MADIDGALFAKPLEITGSPRGGFVVADWGDGAISEFTETGDMLWRSGRQGQGPGEFMQPMDMEFDPEGQLLVSDRGTGRVTTLSETGDLVDSVRYPGEGGSYEILPRGLGGEGWATLGRHPDTLWVAYTATGRVTGINSTPEIRYGESIVGEGWASNFPDGSGAVICFRWSSQMVFLAADGTVDRVVDGVESIAFPRAVLVERSGEGWSVRGHKVDPQATEATLGADASSDRLLVLFGGQTEDAGQIVDSYSRDGEYVGSYLLPENLRGTEIAALRDGGFAILDTTFIPTIWVFDG